MNRNASFRESLKQLAISDQAIETLEFFGIEDAATFEEMPEALLAKMSQFTRLRSDKRLGENQRHQTDQGQGNQRVVFGVFQRRLQ